MMHVTHNMEQLDSLLFQGVCHRLINISLRCWAQRGCDGQQRIHLLVLLQDLIILRTALVVSLHSAPFTPALHIATLD